jgi:hypothetical protein
MKQNADPTKSTYNSLTDAFDYYNENLFDGELPRCLITLQRKNMRTAGYYSPGRFKKTSGKEKTDEIAINPAYMEKKKFKEVLSTLVHEMVHLWQEHLGKQNSRTAYHNTEWGEKMESIGLMPSSTGKPGGKKTGQKMGDYIIENGLFENKTKELLKRGFSFPWGEVGVMPTGWSGRKVKYTCPVCLVNVWGKSNLALACMQCKVKLNARSL